MKKNIILSIDICLHQIHVHIKIGGNLMYMG